MNRPLMAPHATCNTSCLGSAFHACAYMNVYDFSIENNSLLVSKIKKICAPSGNRTRVARMGILHDTTTPTAHALKVKSFRLLNLTHRSFDLIQNKQNALVEWHVPVTLWRSDVNTKFLKMCVPGWARTTNLSVNSRTR